MKFHECPWSMMIYSLLFIYTDLISSYYIIFNFIYIQLYSYIFHDITCPMDWFVYIWLKLCIGSCQHLSTLITTQSTIYCALWHFFRFFHGWGHIWPHVPDMIQYVSICISCPSSWSKFCFPKETKDTGGNMLFTAPRLCLEQCVMQISKDTACASTLELVLSYPVCIL